MSGVWNNVCNQQALTSGLKPGVRTFGEDLKEAGYNLAFSGKWHVSVDDHPRDRGWEELYVTSGKGTHHGKTWDQIKQSALRPEQTNRKYGGILRKGYGQTVEFGATENGNSHDDKAVDLAAEAIERLSREDKPWAVFVGTIMPHSPYNVPQKYLDMYNLDDIKLPENYYDDLKDKPNYYRKLRDMRFGQLSELEVRDGIRHFWAMCTYLDDLFGKLLDTLDKTGQAEDTLVLYCSDHGDYLGEHGLFEKGVPSFLSAYNVPAVVRWPNGLKNPGRRVDELVSLADFAPTFTELSGINRTRRSLVKVLFHSLKISSQLNGEIQCLRSVMVWKTTSHREWRLIKTTNTSTMDLIMMNFMI
jgi:arylsulfatase A-like enzyme